MYLHDLITSEVRIKILKELYSETKKSLYVRELTRRVGTEINAVRRELKKLTLAGVLRKEKRGNRLYYLVKKDYPLYTEIVALIAKETGIGSKLVQKQSALGKVKLAALSLEYAEGRESRSDQLDLLIIGQVNLELLDELIKNETHESKREINYTVVGEEEFEYLKSRRDVFVLSFLIAPNIILFGDTAKYLSFR